MWNPAQIRIKNMKRTNDWKLWYCFHNVCLLSADEHGEEENRVEADRPISPADSYDELYNPFCSNGEFQCLKRYAQVWRVKRNSEGDVL